MRVWGIAIFHSTGKNLLSFLSQNKEKTLSFLKATDRLPSCHHFQKPLKNLQANLHDKIRNEQFSFWPGHSTTFQLVKLIDNPWINANNNEFTAAFIDVEEAIDKILYDRLIFRLATKKTPANLIKMIESFTKKSLLCWEMDGEKSTFKLVKAGLPQGSCLSLTLFNIFTNDLPVIDCMCGVIYHIHHK